MKPGEGRIDPKLVGKGDCYIANYHLQGMMQESSIARAKGEVFLCHGILTAPDFYVHMKPGTQFMHAWVEHKHDEHGWTMHDASLGEYTWHTKKVFYEQMKPRAVYRMTRTEAKYHVARTGKIGRWDLFPDHRGII